jgi:glycosyltransferase involved in cell wall biosynthesis
VTPTTGEAPVRVLRVIARLNVGGPSIQAITLTARLGERGYETLLVRGVEGEREGSMDHLADALGVRPRRLGDMRREPGIGDLRALWALARIVRRFRPDIVHTHAAKAGTLGRLAVVLAGIRPRPVVVHTYHGHSLAGYFSPRVTSVYRGIEQLLARATDRLVAVAPQVRDELVGMRVAAPERFEVVPLGFDLAPFADDATRERRRHDVRTALGLPGGARVVTIVARLEPIKRVDRFLRMAAALPPRDDVRFLVVGDGELATELRATPEAASLGPRLVWAGFRRDMAAVCAASDVVVLTSDNEGTPVSLIEAQAAGVPAVSTDVGGVRSVVADGETGYVVAAGDEAALARAVGALVDDPEHAAALGRAGQVRALERFSLDRLVDDVDDLYRRLLRERRG